MWMVGGGGGEGGEIIACQKVTRIAIFMYEGKARVHFFI